MFVAMGFASQFDHRWEKVIKPGISRVAMDDIKLEAHRVDASVVGDSILTEILQGIANDRLIFADISTLHVLNDTACRNANVMYEVGIAHALRLPEEVLLFRSDDHRLLFDLANVRVHKYDPDNDEKAACEKVAETVFEALKEVDLRKSAFVHRAADALDGSCFDLLSQTVASGGIVKQPSFKTMVDAVSNTRYLAAISRMLELGILHFENFKITPELFEASADLPVPYQYRITPFGKSVFRVLVDRTGLSEPGIVEKLTALFEKQKPGSGPKFNQPET